MFFRKNIALCKNKITTGGHFYYKKTFERAVYRRLGIMLSAMLVNLLSATQVGFLQPRVSASFSNTGCASYSRASELPVVARLSYLQQYRVCFLQLRKCSTYSRACALVTIGQVHYLQSSKCSTYSRKCVCYSTAMTVLLLIFRLLVTKINNFML